MHSPAEALSTAYVSPPGFEPAATVRTLIVDDDATVASIFSHVLNQAGYDVHTAHTAQAALDLMARAVFDVILLDIHLPDIDGFALLQRVHGAWPELPVIMITGSSDVETARKALHAGASDFVTKPCNISELPIIVERNLTRNSLARRRTLNHLRELESSYETVLDALLSALDTRDTETEGHSERVTAYTMLLAEHMQVPQEELYHIERGALLHDIGKIGIPDRILLKPGPLTPEEWVEMKKHPVIGFRMCSKIDFLKGAAHIVLHHHERWDGKGYPDGLAGETIPLGARIFAVADTFDAMTTDRPYRSALTYAHARAEFEKHSGSQFDPAVVKAFLQVPQERWMQIQGRSRKGKSDAGRKAAG
jgi:putative nucleotidyltransferase with HDIG domain